MEYGKFNSAEELLKGYTELEKSFTQKCQQLSALEKQIKSSGTSGQPSPQANTEVAQSTADDTAQTVPVATDTDGSAQQAESATLPISQIGQYLAEHPELLREFGTVDKLSDEQRPPKVMTGGGNVSMALPNRPKTLKEASELAKKYFN